jgi:Uncharacterized conserved protein
LATVNKKPELAEKCRNLAQEVETALKKYAIFNHPKYGQIYAFEVDGFGKPVFLWMMPMCPVYWQCPI